MFGGFQRELRKNERENKGRFVKNGVFWGMGKSSPDLISVISRRAVFGGIRRLKKK